MAEEEITICPHCGSDVSSVDSHSKPGPFMVLGWTGKQLCPHCNYYGFFVSVPRSRLKELEFPNKDAKLNRKDAEKQISRENNSWLVAVIFITVCATLFFLLLTM